MCEQDRTLERKHSIYGFHKQVNLVKRTWDDDLRAMSYGLGIAIIVLVTEQTFLIADDHGDRPAKKVRRKSPCKSQIAGRTGRETVCF